MSHDRTTSELIRWFDELSSGDTALVGGKNASLGEMVAELGASGIRVPTGFATTASAYWSFVDHNELRPKIAEQLDRLSDASDLAEVGERLRKLFRDAEFPPALREAITSAYEELGGRLDRAEPDVAVRSSATAEDLPEASFAGQQETYLNITGQDELLDACRRCYASLFTDRAINYRNEHGFDHLGIALSIGVQEMVRSDLAGAGVMFTIDTDSGFPRVVLIDAARGLGESVVSGTVDPDEYLVFKPLLHADPGRPDICPIISKKLGEKRSKIVYRSSGSDPTEVVDTDHDERMKYVLDDDEIVQLARWAVVIEDHYGTAMDIEWAKDGDRGGLFIVQARPETVHSRRGASMLTSYHLQEEGERLVSGLAVGDAIAAGTVCVLESPDEIDRFEDGAILVTGITDPDWEPIMKRSAAIITDHGGRTSHAAIVSRELGVAAVIGTGDATSTLVEGQEVTVSCAEGDEGHVYDGVLDFEARDIDLSEIPRTRTRVMLNLADPAAAFRWWRLPSDGVGLARMEFIVNNHIKVHPMALVHPDRVDDETREEILELTAGHRDTETYFVDRLAFAVARISAASWPDPVIVRTSDFKTNEYARLIGGDVFEPSEENPMIGWRGASRYHHDDYREGFALECAALRRVRDEMGLTNTVVMIPFCRTVAEADQVLETMADHGLIRGRNGLQIYVMAEIPANIVLAPDFAERFDGFSIGSNDLTQLILGVDRDSDVLESLFDERDPAVVRSIEALIAAAHDHARPVGFCGQRPSDDPEYAGLLVGAGVDSISIAPDTFLAVKQHVADAESR